MLGQHAVKVNKALAFWPEELLLDEAFTGRFGAFCWHYCKAGMNRPTSMDYRIDKWLIFLTKLMKS